MSEAHQMLWVCLSTIAVHYIPFSHIKYFLILGKKYIFLLGEELKHCYAAFSHMLRIRANSKEQIIQNCTSN